MRGYNFTERVRKSLQLAREEAVGLQHEYVGTEHVLLGLLREGDGVASSVLAELKVNPADLRARVNAMVKTGKRQDDSGDLPYTSRAKKVLELAMSEARDLGHNYVGTEHLLLGLLREQKGIGAQVLLGAGVTMDAARAAVFAVLGAEGSAPRPAGDEPDAMFGISGAGSRRGSARLILAISAIPAWAIGILLILNTKPFEASMGIIVDEKSATIAQAQGAILLGLGFINWLARDVNDRAALWAILYGNFVVQAVSFSIVLRALVRGLIPVSGIGALVMHTVLAAAFLWHLNKLRRSR